MAEAETREEKLLGKCAVAYIIIGVLLQRLGKFDTVDGQKALDYFADDKVTDEGDLIPFPSNEDFGGEVK